MTNIYKTVSFYDGDNLLSTRKVLRGKTVKSIGRLGNKGDRLFISWFTEFGVEWDFDLDCVYLDTVLKAKFQKRTYPVLLMVDGILYKRINVTAGECADVFDIPDKEGYEFKQWLCEDGSEYDTKEPVNSPVVLVASFNKAAAKAIPKSGVIKAVNDEETDSFDTVYLLLGIIGLLVIAAETGVIIYIKRSKK